MELDQATQARLEKAAAAPNELAPVVQDALLSWKKFAIPVAILVVVVLAAAMIVASNRGRMDAANAAAFADLSAVFNDGLEDAPKTTDARHPILNKRIAALQAVITNHPGTPVVPRAKLYIAKTYVDLEQIDEAAKAYADALAAGGNDPILSVLIELGQADLLMEKKEWDGAAAAYDVLINKADATPTPGLATVAKYRKAHCYLAKGDKDLARSAFQSIIDESDAAVEAESENARYMQVYANAAEEVMKLIDIIPADTFSAFTEEQLAQLKERKNTDTGGKIISMDMGAPLN